MAKEFLTDIQVEEEITRLTKSPYVKLARQAERIKYQRRQYLYNLRDLEKKGKALFDSGIDFEDEEALIMKVLGDEFED